MNTGHRRCNAWARFEDENGHVFGLGCNWPRGHPDRHWSQHDGIVYRWEKRWEIVR